MAGKHHHNKPTCLWGSQLQGECRGHVPTAGTRSKRASSWEHRAGAPEEEEVQKALPGLGGVEGWPLTLAWLPGGILWQRDLPAQPQRDEAAPLNSLNPAGVPSQCVRTPAGDGQPLSAVPGMPQAARAKVSEAGNLRCVHGPPEAWRSTTVSLGWQPWQGVQCTLVHSGGTFCPRVVLGGRAHLSHFPGGLTHQLVSSLSPGGLSSRFCLHSVRALPGKDWGQSPHPHHWGMTVSWSEATSASQLACPQSWTSGYVRKLEQALRPQPHSPADAPNKLWVHLLRVQDSGCEVMWLITTPTGPEACTQTWVPGLSNAGFQKKGGPGLGRR